MPVETNSTKIKDEIASIDRELQTLGDVDGQEVAARDQIATRLAGLLRRADELSAYADNLRRQARDLQADHAVVHQRQARAQDLRMRRDSLRSMLAAG